MLWKPHIWRHMFFSKLVHQTDTQIVVCVSAFCKASLSENIHTDDVCEFPLIEHLNIERRIWIQGNFLHHRLLGRVVCGSMILNYNFIMMVHISHMVCIYGRWLVFRWRIFHSGIYQRHVSLVLRLLYIYVRRLSRGNSWFVKKKILLNYFTIWIHFKYYL